MRLGGEWGGGGVETQASRVVVGMQRVVVGVNGAEGGSGGKWQARAVVAQQRVIHTMNATTTHTPPNHHVETK